MAARRTILHVDMDAFFAAIEQLDRRELRGRPVLVGHDGPRGVVSTASYEARPFGCHSAQPMAVARRLCPRAVVVPVRGHRYREFSRRLFEILDEFSPLVEPLSVDEAFLDATGSERLLGSPRDQAVKLKQRIARELKLTASVGVAPNKFLAKLASELDKPDGLTMIGPEEVETLLPTLPVTRIWGVGPATASRLASHGITTIGDLRRVPLAILKLRLGEEAERYHRLARGLDDRPVVPDSRAKSIGHERTFERDVADRRHLLRVLLHQVEMVARRLRRAGLQARTVSVKIRFGRFETINRARTLDRPTDVTPALWNAARGLFTAWSSSAFQPVRLIGVSATQLSAGADQMELFESADGRHQRIDEAADRIVERFGPKAIRRGATLE